MSHILSINSSLWKQTIESHGEECLVSPISAKNVYHVLSTATVRGPQSKLCSAVISFVPKMMGNAQSISILTSLVRYGTPKTVDCIAEAVMAANAKLWTLVEEPEKTLDKPMSQLLEGFVFREDSTGDACQKIVQSLKTSKTSYLLSSNFTLPAVGRLMLVDSDFARSIAKDSVARKSLLLASTLPQSAYATETFCRTALETGDDNEYMSTHELVSNFLFGAFSEDLEEGSVKKLRDDMLLIFTSSASLSTISKLGKLMAKWSNLTELIERDTMAKAVAHLLERCQDDRVGKALASALFSSVSDIDERLSSRRIPQLRLLAAVAGNKQYINAVNQKLGASQDKKLRAASVLYSNATVPKAVSTQSILNEKLKALQQKPNTSKPKKRLRE